MTEGQALWGVAAVQPAFDLSIVIVTWNVAADLRDCLLSLRTATQAAPFTSEVIVVDNASADGTLDMLRDEFPEAIVIANSANAGFSAANNQGIAMARGRYVLALNPDTVVEPGTLAQCLAYMDEHPATGALGCMVCYPDGAIQPECARNFPSLRDSVLESAYLHMLFPHSRLCGHSLMTYWDHRDSRDVPCIVGAFMLLRRQTLDKVGLFDTAVPMYLDDLDLCYRIGQAGWRIHYLASARIVHKGGRSEAKTARQRDPVAAEAKYVFFLKHHGQRAARAYRLIIFGRALYRMTLAALLWPVRSLLSQRNGAPKALSLARHMALLRWSLSARHISRPLVESR